MSITASELFKITEEQAEKGMTLGNAFKSLLKGAVSLIMGLPDKLSNKALEIIHYHDDNIAVPAGSKTLTGEDFSSLYEDVKTVEHNTSDGGSDSYIESKSSYRTEMYGLISGHWMSYDLCSDSTKAAYEITLLSKKYANMYQDGNDEYNDKLAEQYSSKMAEYKSYCDSNNLDWDTVLRDASGELQIESYEYKEASKSLVTNIGPVGTDFDKERIISNRAHIMVKTCMDDSSRDSLPPRLEGKIEYNDTLDTKECQDAKFFNKIAAWFKDKCEQVKNFVTNFHPIRSVSQSVKKTVANTVDRVNALDNNQFDSSASEESVVSASDGLGY